MKECILGISSFGHDTSACLVDVSNSNTIFASAQERYSNIKFDDTVPFYTINECLKIAEKLGYKIIKATISCDYKLFIGDYLFKRVDEILQNKNLSLDYINLLKKNLNHSNYYNKFNLSKNCLTDFYSDKKSLLSNRKLDKLKDLTSWYFNWSIKHREIHKIIQKFIGKIELIPINHHLSHAASAYFNSGFENSNIIVIDGQGEEDAITIYDASGRNINLISKTLWPNSLGIFYLEGTRLLGYGLGDEYKVMGMSAYGHPKFKKYIDQSFSVNSNGQLEIKETDYIGFCNIKNTEHRKVCFKNEFKKFFENFDKTKFQQEHFDFAKSIQNTVEDIGVSLSEWAFEKTNKNKICLSGGVALNGLMNNKILSQNYFVDAFVYPASGDDGTSVGSALYYLSQNKEYNLTNKKISTCFYGYKEKLQINKKEKIFENLIIEKKVNIEKFIAHKLNENCVIALYDTNLGSEFGPRALGARSILASPVNENMKEILNKKIKLREPFRPFAPVCIDEYVKDYFKIKCNSNFMLFICETKEDKKHLIPSVVHQDNTARVQSVNKDNKNLYNILNEFYKISKIPILINTSFNIGGEAIVNSVDDAIASFKKMDIDYLVINEFILSKPKNTKKHNIDTSQFIKNRRLKFEKENKFPKIKIGYYNSNFYSNFFSFVKRKLYEKIFQKIFL